MREIKIFKEYADHIKINNFGLSRSFSFKRINFYYLIILVMKYRKYIILDKGLETRTLFKNWKLSTIPTEVGYTCLLLSKVN